MSDFSITIFLQNSTKNHFHARLSEKKRVVCDCVRTLVLQRPNATQYFVRYPLTAPIKNGKALKFSNTEVQRKIKTEGEQNRSELQTRARKERNSTQTHGKRLRFLVVIIIIIIVLRFFLHCSNCDSHVFCTIIFLLSFVELVAIACNRRRRLHRHLPTFLFQVFLYFFLVSFFRSFLFSSAQTENLYLYACRLIMSEFMRSNWFSGYMLCVCVFIYKKIHAVSIYSELRSHSKRANVNGLFSYDHLVRAWHTDFRLQPKVKWATRRFMCLYIHKYICNFACISFCGFYFIVVFISFCRVHHSVHFCPLSNWPSGERDSINEIIWF